MCTLSFYPRAGGYLIGMNRDERKDRARAYPPRLFKLDNGLWAVYPYEEGRGTWIGLNSVGISLALLNWHKVPSRFGDQHAPVSRGQAIPLLLREREDRAMHQKLCELPLDQMHPFRLIGFFPAKQLVVEWLWNQKRLLIRPRGWEARLWASSGWDEASVQAHRRKLFEHALRAPDAGTPIWLRRFHRSHDPIPGPLSVCVHREDVCTVSYTEILVVGRRGQMLYHDGPPCEHCRRVEKGMRVDFWLHDRAKKT